MRGSIGAPISLAGVKIVGDYVDNYQHGLPSEMATQTCSIRRLRRAQGHARRHQHHRDAHRRHHRPRRQVPRAQGRRVLGHIGARGTAYWNVRLTQAVRVRRDRVHSRLGKPRVRRELSRDLGRRSWRSTAGGDTVKGADIVVKPRA
jgi:ornithine cyclodeaminase